MPAATDKALVRRLFEEVWNQNNVDAAKDIVHEDYSSIENQVFASAPGPQIVAAEVELYRSLYDGLHFEIERMFVEGSTVVTIWKATGTSRHETFINRSGRAQPKWLDVEGVSLSEVRDGKISAHRFLWPRRPISS